MNGMKKKKSRIELAREIIANLRQGMNRPQAAEPKRSTLIEATPFMPAASTPVRPRRAHQSHSLQTFAHN